MRQMIGELYRKRKMIKRRDELISSAQTDIVKWTTELEECKIREKELLFKLASEKKTITPTLSC